MKRSVLHFILCVFTTVVGADSEYFNDYSQRSWNEDPVSPAMIQQLATYLRDQPELVAAAAQARSEEEEESEESEEQPPQQADAEELFTYRLPEPSREVRPFAVGPGDPRYYDDKRSDTSPQAERAEVVTDVTEPRGRGTVEDAQPAEESDPVHSAIYQTPIVNNSQDKSDLYFTAIVAGCSAAAVVGVVAVGISCYKLQKNTKAAADVEYPAYGVTGPNKDLSPNSGDRRLAQSAQMYHYQHQKQQIIAMERATNERHGSVSDAESDEENEEGDYTVYECPGLASTGEMEVKNPLFQDDPTPASPAKTGAEQQQQSQQGQGQHLPK